MIRFEFVYSGWHPLSALHDQRDGAQVHVIDTAGDVWGVVVQHGPERGHGATLAVELPPNAVLWRRAAWE